MNQILADGLPARWLEPIHPLAVEALKKRVAESVRGQVITPFPCYACGVGTAVRWVLCAACAPKYSTPAAAAADEPQPDLFGAIT